MDSEKFTASRWTSGNHLFPTVIEVTDQAVIRHKRSWFSKDEMSISITKVASVHIKTGIFWSDILIESSGGSDPVASHGHRKADARRIRALVEAAQGILSGPEKLKLS
jgi:hypothetical protein